MGRPWMTRTYYEFFAGGGMVRAGLGPGWTCLFANDFDPMKAAAYCANWGDAAFTPGDVADVLLSSLPGTADLAWASFPCQDLSLAGDGAGLGGPGSATRSGTFWPFWRLMQALVREGRGPRAIVLENVAGVLTSRGGRDFGAICGALAGAGYRAGALVIDAALFVPQSRPRVFFAAVRAGAHLAERAGPSTAWHPPALLKAQAGLPEAARRAWVWWTLPVPPVRVATLADLLDDAPFDPPERTTRLLALMSPLHRTKVQAAGRAVGAVYRRTRPGPDGARLQRAEVRFDGLAGCLRTPGGGSSRQTILSVDGGRVRSRLLTARETARLTGLDESFRLPARYNDACHVTGDGVCPPVVRHLAAGLLEPMLDARGDAAA